MKRFKKFITEASIYDSKYAFGSNFALSTSASNATDVEKFRKALKDVGIVAKTDSVFTKIAADSKAPKIEFGSGKNKISFEVDGKKINVVGSQLKIFIKDANTGKDPVGGAPNSTYYYEQWQSIGMLGLLDDSDCDAILDGKATNAIIKKFKDAYKKGLGEIGKGPKEFPKALDHPTRLQDAAMLVKGSIKFTGEYSKYIEGGTVVWGDITTYYDLMKTQGPNLVKSDEKQNTADAVVLKDISLSDLNKEDLVFEYFPGDKGVITVTQRKKKLGTILQVSMKKSHKDARLGKIKDVFTNKGFFGDTPAEVLNRYVKENYDPNEEYVESLQEGLLDYFKSVKTKLSSWAQKLKGTLNKIVTWVSKWFLSLINKHFNTSKMQKSSEDKLNKYFSMLKESNNILQEKKLSSADHIKYILSNKTEGQPIVDSIVTDMNKEVDRVLKNIRAINKKAKNNRFLGVLAIDKYNAFTVTRNNPKDFNTLRQFIMNYTSLETLNKMTKTIASGTKTLNLMVTTFIDFMESAYMGNTTLPIIKLYGIKTSSEKAIEVVDKESFDAKRDNIVKRMKEEKIPTGGAVGRIKKGEEFGVFYLYTIAGIEDDGTVNYNSTRLTSYGEVLAYKIESEGEIDWSTLEKRFPIELKK